MRGFVECVGQGVAIIDLQGAETGRGVRGLAGRVQGLTGGLRGLAAGVQGLAVAIALCF